MTHDAFDEQPQSGGRELPSAKLVGLLLVVVAIAIFFFQNSSDAQVEFLWMDVTWPVRSVIVISVILGVLLDRLGSWMWRRARRRKEERIG